MPFRNGKGGKAVPIPGASQNGMSNNFAKVSPDGKFIVFVQCNNGLLMRPDSKLWIVPAEGGEARLMKCNTPRMNSWHSFSPNIRWMVFSSKANTYYTQLFLTHIDEQGNDSPPIFIPRSTADNRAVNIPEFVNINYEDMQEIKVPAVRHFCSASEKTAAGSGFFIQAWSPSPRGGMKRPSFGSASPFSRVAKGDSSAKSGLAGA